MESKPVKRITRLHIANLDHPASAIFPLFCPVKEYDWIDGWDCELVYSNSGSIEQDCIFRCKVLTEESVETWVCDTYAPNDRVQFNIRFDGCIVRYSLSLFEKPDKTTISTWHMTITAYDEPGYKFIRKNSPEAFKEKFLVFETMINHYLHTGDKLLLAKP